MIYDDFTKHTHLIDVFSQSQKTLNRCDGFRKNVHREKKVQLSVFIFLGANFFQIKFHKKI